MDFPEKSGSTPRDFGQMRELAKEA
jgi:hypothetical protein